MTRSLVLAATAAVLLSVSPAVAEGPTVLTDAELDAVVAGDTLISTTLEGGLEAGKPFKDLAIVPADIYEHLDDAIGCGGRCRLPRHTPAINDSRAHDLRIVAFTPVL